MALFQHAPVQHAPVLEFGKTEVLRHCVALQFASIWEHLNDFRLWTFQKSAAGAAEVTDNEAAHAPAPLTHGVITGPITQVANLRFSLMKMEI